MRLLPLTEQSELAFKLQSTCINSVKLQPCKLHHCSTQAMKQIEQLQNQLQQLNIERDRLQVQLNKSQEQAKQYAAESSNLHIVLEQFTQGERTDRKTS